MSLFSLGSFVAPAANRLGTTILLAPPVSTPLDCDALVLMSFLGVHPVCEFFTTSLHFRSAAPSMSSRRQPTTSIGQRIRELRKQKGLSQRGMEGVSGLHACYISRVEHGHSVPTLETLEKFAKALDVPLYRLFYSGEQPPPTPRLTPRKTLEELAAETKSEARFFSRLKSLFRSLADSDRKVLLGLARQLAGREPDNDVSPRNHSDSSH